jgi:cytochrome c oxidase assembly protein subunit 11
MVGQAIPSVTPGQAAKYFKKTECFCFTEQRFKGREGRDMPLVFMVDPDLPEDIKELSLAYTFFDKQKFVN